MSKIPGSAGERILQRKYGSTKKALDFYNKQVKDRLFPEMRTFIKQQSMCFISSSDKNGQTNTSFRAGSKGFIQVLSETRLIYPEFKGQGVMVTLGCISENPHIGLLFMDFEKSCIGLHVNGKANIVEKEDIKEFLTSKEYSCLDNEHERITQRYVVIDLHECYIHCSLNIPKMKRVDPIEYKPKKKKGDFFHVEDYPTLWTFEKEASVETKQGLFQKIKNFFVKK